MISLFLFLYRSVGIPALLDVEDMVRLKKPEPRSVQCYVQMIFSKYRPKDLDMSNLIIAWRSLNYFCLQYAISTVARLHFGFSLRIIDWGKGISFHAENSRKNWVSRCSKFGCIHKCICLFGDISTRSFLYRLSVRCYTTSGNQFSTLELFSWDNDNLTRARSTHQLENTLKMLFCSPVFQCYWMQ